MTPPTAPDHERRAVQPRPSVILNTVLDMVFRTALLFSFFLLFAGHNAPGGGFIGGLVASAGLVLRYVAGGAPELERVVRMHETTLLGTGLVIATATGMVGWLLGGAFLYSGKLEVDVAVLGTLKATSALPFDLGVYLVVIGLTLALLRSLGAAADRDVDHDETTPRRGVTR